MITTRFFLDRRYALPGQPAPIKIVITKNCERSYVLLSVSVLPEHWDSKRQMVVGHPRKVAINNLLQSKKVEVDEIIFRLQKAGELKGLRSSQIKERVVAELYPSEPVEVATPYSCFKKFMKKKRGRTLEIYEASLSRLESFCPKFSTLKFEALDVHWLEDFEDFLSATAPSRNARNIHLRNLRAVFNFAIDEDLTSCYPFRKFKIRAAPTRKRSLPVEKLRMLFNASVSASEQKYLDFFKLTFMLCGINIVDLCLLPHLLEGRAEYCRAKTQRLYSIKVEPEAMAIFDKYRGFGQALDVMDSNKNYRSFYKHLATFLREFGKDHGMPGLSTYWARHSWATMAAELDVPDAVISQALGHGPENRVTEVYIWRNLKKVDEANRKVLDWVLYKKR